MARPSSSETGDHDVRVPSLALVIVLSTGCRPEPQPGAPAPPPAERRGPDAAQRFRADPRRPRVEHLDACAAAARVNAPCRPGDGPVLEVNY